MANRSLRWIATACVLCASGAASYAQELESSRMAAAEKLFQVPAYRQIATRQIYETLQSLPPEQSRAALDALRDPAVVSALRQVIARAMAGTYTTKELEFLEKVFSAPEMESFVKRETVFRDQLRREFTAALLTNPALIGRIPLPSK
ncbi:MAG: hypothetical protein ACKVQA_11380 [Burkholderiales bacterium]